VVDFAQLIPKLRSGGFLPSGLETAAGSFRLSTR
jgi:hypothetical protein